MPNNSQPAEVSRAARAGRPGVVLAVVSVAMFMAGLDLFIAMVPPFAAGVAYLSVGMSAAPPNAAEPTGPDGPSPMLQEGQL